MYNLIKFPLIWSVDYLSQKQTREKSWIQLVLIKFPFCFLRKWKKQNFFSLPEIKG